MSHHKFSSLQRKMSPSRRKRNKTAAKEMMGQILLAELRKRSGITQRELADLLGVRQPTIAQMEKQSDMQMSTLQRIVTAIGGEMDVIIRLPQGQVRMSHLGKRRSA